MPVSDYSTTPSANTSISGINIAEGCPPGGLNNAARQMMADIRSLFSAFWLTIFAETDAAGVRTAIDAAQETPSSTALGNLTPTANNLPYYVDATTAALAPLTAFARTLLDDADIATAAATLGAVGPGQTWQDVSGSRAINTSYQNTSGRAIQVNVLCDTGNDTDVIQVSANGSTWITVARCRYYGSSGNIIPPGSYYRVTGTPTIITWAELR